jgi:hypothetical protein
MKSSCVKLEDPKPNFFRDIKTLFAFNFTAISTDAKLRFETQVGSDSDL